MKIQANEPQWTQLVPEPILSQIIPPQTMLLDGIWNLRNKNTSEPEEEVTVPFDISVTKGYKKTCFVLTKTVELPQGAENFDKILRFEGINGYTRIYVDDSFVMEHWNSFLTFNSNITAYLKGKKSFVLTVELYPGVDKVCSFSFGGILHSVKLFFVPKVHATSLHVRTTFTDTAYTDALMEVMMSVEGIEQADNSIYADFVLTSDRGERFVFPERLIFQKDRETETIKIPVPAPAKWDSEHPNLYTLTAQIYDNGALLETVMRTFGFRQIERRKNQVFVNGDEIKLRGSCRHEISMKGGRCITKADIEQDVSLFLEANCNYIRTSHYPCSEYFLDLCDKYGIYVELEMGLAFIARSLDYTQRDPEQTDRYLSNFAETAARDMSHPSILIWSLCNESFGGYNFDLLNHYVHKTDPSRLTKFSYPMTMREEHEPIDVWSIHYSNLEEDLAKLCDNVSVGGAFGYELPVLHDEYAHIPCYNRTEHRRDPNVRNFWGESIRLFWDKIWNTKGALGGAIWAGIDEVNVVNGQDTALEWGIIDVYRRKKPEHYLTRKAYSPIKLWNREAVLCGSIDEVKKSKEQKSTSDEGRNNDTFNEKNKEDTAFFTLQIENRFCHTNLSEVRLTWECDTMSGTLSGPDLKPFETREWNITLTKEQAHHLQRTAIMERNGSESNGRTMKLKFVDARGIQVDEYELPLLTEVSFPEKKEKLETASKNSLYDDLYKSPFAKKLPEFSNQGEIQIREDKESVLLTSQHIAITFSKKSGMIVKGSIDGKPVITNGPVLNVPYLKLGTWKLSAFFYTQGVSLAVVQIEGSYEGTMDVRFTLKIDSSGLIETAYRIERLYVTMPREIKLRVGVDCGGIDELGVAYTMNGNTNWLSWEKDGLWSVYPDDHIARRKGIAQKNPGKDLSAFELPVVSWAEEAKSYALFGPYAVNKLGSNDFRSSKEFIREATAGGENMGCLTALSDGSHAVRMETVLHPDSLVYSQDNRIKYQGTWVTQTDLTGSRSLHEVWSKDPESFLELSFTGTGIIWYGSVDTIYGYASVSIDGKLIDNKVNQKVNGVEFPGSASGTDKKYQIPIFSITDLSEGEHTIRICPTGEKSPEAKDSYIVIDYFCILSGQYQDEVAMIINNAWNYPQISWGNYCKPPIRIAAGYENKVMMRLDAER